MSESLTSADVLHASAGFDCVLITGTSGAGKSHISQQLGGFHLDTLGNGDGLGHWIIDVRRLDNWLALSVIDSSSPDFYRVFDVICDNMRDVIDVLKSHRKSVVVVYLYPSIVGWRATCALKAQASNLSRAWKEKFLMKSRMTSREAVRYLTKHAAMIERWCLDAQVPCVQVDNPYDDPLQGWAEGRIEIK